MFMHPLWFFAQVFKPSSSFLVLLIICWWWFLMRFSSSTVTSLPILYLTDSVPCTFTPLKRTFQHDQTSGKPLVQCRYWDRTLLSLHSNHFNQVSWLFQRAESFNKFLHYYGLMIYHDSLWSHLIIPVNSKHLFLSSMWEHAFGVILQTGDAEWNQLFCNVS